MHFSYPRLHTALAERLGWEDREILYGILRDMHFEVHQKEDGGAEVYGKANFRWKDFARTIFIDPLIARYEADPYLIAIENIRFDVGMAILRYTHAVDDKGKPTEDVWAGTMRRSFLSGKLSAKEAEKLVAEADEIRKKRDAEMATAPIITVEVPTATPPLPERPERPKPETDEEDFGELRSALLANRDDDDPDGGN